MDNCVPLKPGLEPFPGTRLHQLLGHGGYGEVWEAWKDGAGARVALKFLPCTENDAAAREIRTLQSIRSLEHPNLTRMNNIWTFGGYIVIDMELAEGSLLDLLDAYFTEFGTPVIAEQVCLYLAQAAAALDFLNIRQHVIDGKRVAVQHCDIKPSNLLLFGDTVKLADFGLASLITSTFQSHRRAGTLDYMAPEVFLGRLSERTDQYALAVSYCQLRGGKFPFSDTPKDLKKSYVRPDPDLTMLPEGERPIIARGLAHAPSDRWPSCTDMIEELTKQVS